MVLPGYRPASFNFSWFAASQHLPKRSGGRSADSQEWGPATFHRSHKNSSLTLGAQLLVQINSEQIDKETTEEVYVQVHFCPSWISFLQQLNFCLAFLNCVGMKDIYSRTTGKAKTASSWNSTGLKNTSACVQRNKLLQYSKYNYFLLHASIITKANKTMDTSHVGLRQKMFIIIIIIVVLLLYLLCSAHSGGINAVTIL